MFTRRKEANPKELWTKAIKSTLAGSEVLLSKAKGFVSFVESCRVMPSSSTDQLSQQEVEHLITSLRDLFYLFSSARSSSGDESTVKIFSNAATSALFGIKIWIQDEQYRLLLITQKNPIPDLVDIAETPQGLHDSIELLATLLKCTSPILSGYLQPYLPRLIALISRPLTGDRESHRKYLVLKIIEIVPSSSPISSIESVADDHIDCNLGASSVDSPLNLQPSSDGNDVGTRKFLNFRKPLSPAAPGSISESISFRGINLAIGAVGDFLGLSTKSNSWLLSSRAQADISDGSADGSNEFCPLDGGLSLPLSDFSIENEKYHQKPNLAVGTYSKSYENYCYDIPPSVLWEIVKVLPSTVTNEAGCAIVLKSIRILVAKHQCLHEQECFNGQMVIDIVTMMERVLLTISPSALKKKVTTNHGEHDEHLVSMSVVLDGRQEKNPESYLENCYRELLGIMFGQENLDLLQKSHFPIIHPTLQIIVHLYSSQFPMLISIATRCLLYILRKQPKSVIVLEKSEVIGAVLKTFLNFVFYLSFLEQSDEVMNGVVDLEGSSAPDIIDLGFTSTPDDNISAISGASGGDLKCDYSKSMQQQLRVSLLRYSCSTTALLELLDLLLLISVITVNRDNSPLGFLIHVISVICKRHPKAANTCSSTSNSSNSPYVRCHNCESEPASFQCLNIGCPCNAANCTLCDQVFHKAVAKRCHIRIPFLQTSTEETTNSYPILEVYRNAILNSKLILLNVEGKNLTLLCPVLSLLLAGTRSIIDDRRMRCLEVPGAYLGSIIESILNFYTKFEVLAVNWQMIDSRELPLMALLRSLADYRFDTLVPKTDITVTGYESVDSPSESNIYNCHRIVTSLFIQLISRFFITDILSTNTSKSIPNITKDEEDEDSFTTGQVSIKCDPQCSRAELYSRLQLFRKYGCEAFFSYLITSDTMSSLTQLDRNFLAWSLREISVTACEVNDIHCQGIIRWFSWMLRGPLRGSDDAVESKKGHDSTASKDGSSDSVDDLFSPIPTSSPALSSHTRILLLQELRLFIGGSSYDSVLKSLCEATRNKILMVPWLAIPQISSSIDDGGSSLSTRFNKQNNPLLLCSAMCRIPISRSGASELLAETEIIEALLDLIMGKTCNSSLIEVIDTLNIDEAAADHQSSILVKNDDIEEWWSAFTLLATLLDCCSSTKLRVEQYVGVQNFIRFILPLAHSRFASKCVIDVLCSMCIPGKGLSKSSRPFLLCAKLSQPQISFDNSVPLIFRRDYTYNEKIVSAVHPDSEEPLFSLMAPSYFTYGRSVSMMTSVLRPSVVSLVPFVKYFAEVSQSKQTSTVRAISKDRQISHASLTGTKLSTQSLISLQDGDVEDNKSTDRGSVHSFHALGVSKHLTPTPSLHGSIGNAFTIADNLSLISEDISSNFLKARSSSIVDDHFTPILVTPTQNSGFSFIYVPLVHSLNWGLAHCAEYIVQEIYESMLSRVLGKSSDISFLRRALKRHLQIFIPRGFSCELQPEWSPNLSSISFVTAQEIREMLALIAVSRGLAQKRVYDLLIKILDSNPNNADILNRGNLQFLVIRLIVNAGDTHLRKLYSDILCKVFQHDTTPQIVSTILNEVQVFYQNPKNLDIQSDLFNVLYKSLLQKSPNTFLHFPQDTPFNSKVTLPPIEKIPSSKIGITLSCWIRVGAFGETPISCLFQLSHKKFVDNPSEEPRLQSLNVFFRASYKVTNVLKDVETSSANSGLSYHPTDFVQQETETPKKVLNLCISSCTILSPTSTISSLLVPDAIVDYDWSELDLWKLLTLTFDESSGGVSCFIDGVKCRVKQWSPLGYINLSCDSEYSIVKKLYPAPSKDNPLIVSIGGLHAENTAFKATVERLNKKYEDYKSGTLEEDEEAYTILQNLKCFYRVVSGFAGDIGDFVIIEGNFLEKDQLKCVELGTHKLINRLDQKLLANFTSELMENNFVRDRGRSGIKSLDTFSTRTLSPARVKGESDAEPDSSSIVSDLFTMFSFSSKASEGGSTSRGGIVVEGQISCHRTIKLVDTLLNLGGFKILYRFISREKFNLLPIVKIICAMILASQSASDNFEKNENKFSLLYSLKNFENIPQVNDSIKFILESSARFNDVNSTSHRLLKSSEAIITHISLIQIIISLVVLSPLEVHWANILVKWLRDACEDNFFENTRQILSTIGPIPFLYLLSLWGNHYDRSELKSLCKEDTTEKMTEVQKFQVRISRLVKQLVSPDAYMHKSSTTCLPSGFDSVHMLHFLNFAVGSLRVPSSTSSSLHKLDFKPTAQASKSTLSAVETVLDCLLALAFGPNLKYFVSFSRSLPLSGVLWYLLFDLCGSCYSSIRSRAVRLMIASLATEDRRIDQKQLANFEKCNGFSILTEQLSRPIIVTVKSDSQSRMKTEPTILEILLDFLFWKSLGGSSDDCFERLDSLDNFTRFTSTDRTFEIQGLESEMCRDSEEIAHKISSSDQNLGIEQSNSESGLISSIFSGGQLSQIQTYKSTEDEEDSSIRVISASTVSTTELPTSVLGNNAIRMKYSIQTRSSPARRNKSPEGWSSTTETKTLSVFLPPEGAKRELIMIPQVLQIIMKTLSFVKSAETLLCSIKRIEDCLSGFDDISGISEENVTRNAESFTNQKEWLVWICECLQNLDQSIRSGGASESNIYFSDASTNSYDRYPTSTKSSCGDEEVNIYDDPPRVSNLDSIVAQYCDPLFNLIQLLLFIDIKKKPSLTRKYHDVLRLPLPEMHGFQVTILFDLLEAFENSSMRNQEISLNLLKNLAGVLEVINEKTELPIDFCVKAVQTMTVMSFKAVPAVRAKINDTILVETRNSFVIRCLVDRSEDVYVRVAAIVDIHRFVEAVLASADIKVLSESQIIIALLNMFVELTDDLEIMSMSLDNEDILHRCQLAVKFQAAIIKVIVSCTSKSLEGRKTVSRLLATIEPKETSARIMAAFTRDSANSHCASNTPTSEEVSIIKAPEGGTSQKHASTSSKPTSNPNGAQSTAKSSQWWGSWMSTKPTENLSDDTDSIVIDSDVESVNHTVKDTHSATSDSIFNFLQWFNNPLLDRVRREFKTQLAKDLPVLERLGSKFNEKTMQKRSKYMKSVQEKVSKERSMHNKSLKELLEKVKIEGEAGAKKYHADLQRFMIASQDALERGRTIIQSDCEASNTLSEQFILQESVLDIGELPKFPAEMRSAFDIFLKLPTSGVELKK